MIGKRIANYVVTRHLGEGGMGSVFEAVHESLGRRAAVKILHPNLAIDGQVIGRFLNEARATNLIEHPGVVNIFEFGYMDDQTAYIIMELLNGESLEDRLVRTGGRMGISCLDYMRQIACILSAIHSKNIVHRDLKPSNIMIVPDPEVAGGERIKILDFGVAKTAPQDRVPTPQFRTHTGMLLGTPEYMAPEQASGMSGVDGKVDVYALGVIMYRFLSGQLPLCAQGAIAQMAMHISDYPPPLRSVMPGTPARVAALVHRMLAKAPQDRPSMADVATDIALLTEEYSCRSVGLLSAPRKKRTYLATFSFLAGITTSAMVIWLYHCSFGKRIANAQTPMLSGAGVPLLLGTDLGAETKGSYDYSSMNLRQPELNRAKAGAAKLEKPTAHEFKKVNGGHQKQKISSPNKSSKSELSPYTGKIRDDQDIKMLD